MFSLRFLAVRQVRPCWREEGPPLRKMTWSVQPPGPRNSGFVEIGDGSWRPPAGEKKKKQPYNEQSQDPRRPAAVSSAPLWPGEVEVRDKEGQDTVQIALVCEMEANATRPRERFCHSIASIDVVEFRRKPDEKFTFWLPLRSATMASSPFGEEKSNDDDNSDDEKNDDDDAGSGRHDLGAIKVSVTYFSDDCVDQGYWYAMFCGLVPLPLILLWANDNDHNNNRSNTICNTRENIRRPHHPEPSYDTTSTSTSTSTSKKEKERPDKIAPVAMDKRRPSSAIAAAPAPAATSPLQMRIEVL